jgi:hypothetical protein
VQEFRSLAPARRRIPIQVWTFKRVLVTIATTLGALLAVLVVVSNARVL